MTPQEKLTKLIQIAEMIKEAYQDMRNDASRLKKYMQDYRQFIINKIKEIDYDLP